MSYFRSIFSDAEQTHRASEPGLIRMHSWVVRTRKKGCSVGATVGQPRCVLFVPSGIIKANRGQQASFRGRIPPVGQVHLWRYGKKILETIFLFIYLNRTCAYLSKKWEKTTFFPLILRHWLKLVPLVSLSFRGCLILNNIWWIRWRGENSITWQGWQLLFYCDCIGKSCSLGSSVK